MAQYTVVKSRIEDQEGVDQAYELTVIVTLQRDDGVTGEVWVQAGIEDCSRGEVDTATHNGTWGTSRGSESTWTQGDSLDCWCPPEFEEDNEAAYEAARIAALKEWRGRN